MSKSRRRRHRGQSSVTSGAATQHPAKPLPKPSDVWRPEETSLSGPSDGQPVVEAPEQLWHEGEERRDDLAQPQMTEGSSVWRSDEGSTTTIEKTERRAFSKQADLWQRERSLGGDEDPERETGVSLEQRKRRPSARKIVTRSIAALVTIAIILFFADLAYSGVGVYSSLSSLRSHLASARTEFRGGRLDEAHAFLRTSRADGDKALSLTHRPSLAALGALPAIGDDVDAIRAIATAGRLAATAGSKAVSAAEHIGFLGRGIPSSLYSNGRVDFDTVSLASPGISAAKQLLDHAVSVLQTAPSPTLGVVNDALKKARVEIDGAADSARSGSALISLLPGLLGRDTDRTYLLAFQALGESRGTGGVIGLYGLLHASDGAMRLGHIGPFTEFQPDTLKTPVDAVGWFTKNYGPQLALRQWQQANLSPNFPAVARVLLNQYEAGTGDTLDGVIAMDPITLQDLMTATGPVADPITGDPLGPNDVADALMKSSYLRFPNRHAQNSYLTALVQEFWTKIKDGDVAGPALMRGVATAIASQHLKVYSTNSGEEAKLAMLNADGSYEHAGPNVQMAFTNNYSSNKIDYYLHRTVDTTVTLTDSGDAQVEDKIHLVNTAPAGPPSVLLGTGTEGVETGTNRSLVSDLMPANARLTSVKIDGEKTTPFTYQDDQHLVAWHIVTMPSGATSETTVDYFVPRAVPMSTTGGTLRFTLFPQASVRPDDYSFDVVPPPGWRLQASGARTLASGEPVKISGTLTEPRTITIRIVK
ncbi:MAG: DUF4012 domain-containing protein [Actinomycetota bacterium]|nr:DUF4012 domain-containing protein [Actinomycetota bacterium]